MDFPHGNPRHHHQRYSPDNEDYPPPSQPYQRSSYDEPPPPPTQVTRVHHSSPYNDYEPGPESYYAPPPPPTQVTRVHHSSPYNDYGPGPESYYDPPPPPVVNHGYAPPPSSYTRPDYGYAPPPSAGVDYGYDAPPPPPPPNNSGGYSSVEHVSHHVNRPHLPSFAHHDTPQTPEISNKPSVRVYTKAEPSYSLTIRDGRVILARSNPSDPYQHWIKDQKYSTKVKDEEGFPSFSLVNKATGQALKHSVGASHPVQLTPYNPDVLDESVLWTESRDLGDTFRTIRMVNNIKLNVDAWHGDQNHGGVHDGTTIALWEWKKGDNQRWKIVPYCKSLIPSTLEMY